MSEAQFPIPKEDILKIVSAQVMESRSYVFPKRETFKDRIRLYNNQRKQRDKIGILTLYAMQNTLLASSYIDQMAVSFEGRGLEDNLKAKNKDDLAKFDQEEMNMAVIDYFTQWDKYFFGVGIRYVGAWDDVRKVPVPRTFSPMLWLPDPAGFAEDSNFRWQGIEDQRTKAQMTEAAGYIKSAVDKLKTGSKATSEQQDMRRAVSEAQGAGAPDFQPRDVSQQIFDVVHMWTWIEDTHYLITVDDSLKTILRFQELEAVTEEEKKNPRLVPSGLVLNYYSPVRADPFGVSVADLVEDKQRAESVLANIQLAKEKAELYPMYLYDKTKIPNRRDLDFAFNKFIPINGQTAGAVEPMKKDFNKGSTLNIMQSMQAESQRASGADELRMGVLSSQQRTLGEVNQVTLNSNLRQALHTRINSWGEKRFWFLWDRKYRQFFKSTQEKEIRILGGTGVRYKVLRGKDFLTKENPDIVITSTLESAQKKEQKRLAYSQILPLIQADPSRPLAAKNFGLRKAAEFVGLETDEIAYLIPDTPNELSAKMENEILNRGEMPKVQVYDDHLSHLVIHSQAEDTSAKFAHINAHIQAYLLSEQALIDKAAQQQQAVSGGGGINQAIATAQGQVGNQLSNLNSTAQVEQTPQ
jgi:hypothetical protein